MITTVIKRDGTAVSFDTLRIYSAIEAADKSREKQELDVADINKLVAAVCDKIGVRDEDKTSVAVEEIQDAVEKVLMEQGYLDIAKAYILYRNKRTDVREAKSHLLQVFDSIYNSSRESSDLKRENANINTDAPMGMMLKIGSEASKDYALKYMMKPEYAQGHIDGDFHIHDLDFFALTATCVQIPLAKLLARGFTTGHGYSRPPQSIRSAAALTCIILQSSQNDMHGGQSIPNFDYDLAPYVAKSYIKTLLEVCDTLRSVGVLEYSDVARKCAKEVLNAFYKENGTILDENIGVSEILVKYLSDYDYCNIIQRAKQKLEDTVYQSMEALVHNLNSMHSRAGGQVPFSSINFGTCMSEEGRMVIKNFLLSIDAGLGHHETSYFPVPIFKMKAGVNYNPGDKNYDLFKLAMKVSAKRLFPCFSNLDAPFNAQYYKEGRPETEVAYMGCVDEDEVITIGVNGTRRYIRMGDFPKFFEMCKAHNVPVKVKDTISGGWVDVLNCIDNGVEVSSKIGWYEITFEDGVRIFCTADHPLPVLNRDSKGYKFYQAHELMEGMRIKRAHHGVPIVTGKRSWISYADQYMFGILYARGTMSAADVRYSGDIRTSDVRYYMVHCSNDVKLASQYIEDSCFTLTESKATRRGNFCRFTLDLKKFRERYAGLNSGTFELLLNDIEKLCGDVTSKGSLFSNILSWTVEMHAAFIRGIYDVCGSVYNVKSKMDKDNCCVKLKLHKGKDGHVFDKYIEDIMGSVVRHDLRTYSDYVCFNFNPNANEVTHVLEAVIKAEGKPFAFDTMGYAIVGMRKVLTRKAHSYDITTSSGTFDFSGICSHNCRTRVMGNVYDPDNEICTGRGNLSFTTINLPRLGILANKDINKFYELLDDRMNTVCNQLYDRYLVQAQKRVINFPFLMGQGEWLGSDNLGLYDTVGEVFKQGTLGVGYIGLAECLVALTGKHHGESNEAWLLGYSIIKHMREYCDKRANETEMNYSLLMTPAEGLAGRFVRIDKKKFGVIPGVTDKDYYTNSSHIPVWYKITAARKIELEAPFHELANGGHICYIEVDGDPLNNLKAFEDIIRYMHDKGVGYGAINHAVDMDPVCGYIGIIGDECPRCHRREGEPMTIEMYNNIKGYMRKSSNFAFLGDMSENLQQLSDYKQ